VQEGFSAYPEVVTAPDRDSFLVQPSEHPTGIYLKVDLRTAGFFFQRLPYVSIDDSEPDRPFTRAEFFSVDPGWHKVRCFFRDYNTFFLRLGDSSTKVLVPRDCVVSLMWRWRGIADGRRGQFRVIPAQSTRQPGARNK
jgi:hypothetical protein